MKINILLAGVTALLAGAVVQAQVVAPADQAAPPVTTAVQPDQPAASAPAATEAASSAATTTAAADGVTKEGNKYVKDGRPATRVEIASYKKASKTKPE